MSEAERKYVRVYYNDLIRDYPDIWADDAALATWLRMLATADPMWPTPPELPRSVRGRALTRLKTASLVETLPMQRFRMKGMEAERTKRQDAARNAAASRWQSGSSAVGNAEAMPKRAEQSKAEQTRAEQTGAHDPWDDPEREVIVWLAKHGCDVRPGNGYHRKLVTAVEVHGVNALVGMMDRLAVAGTKQGDIKGFLFGAIDALDARGRPSLGDLSKADRADETEAAHKRRLAQTQKYLEDLKAVQ